MSQEKQEPQGSPTITVALGRLGLSHAALAAIISAELDEPDIGLMPGPVASAVAHAIESNNAEILRQLTVLLRDLERFRAGPIGESD